VIVDLRDLLKNGVKHGIAVDWKQLKAFEKSSLAMA